MPIIDIYKIKFFSLDFYKHVCIWWKKNGGKVADVTDFSDYVRITVKPEELDKIEEIIVKDGPLAATIIVLPIKEGRFVPLLVNGKSWKLEQRLINIIKAR